MDHYAQFLSIMFKQCSKKQSIMLNIMPITTAIMSQLIYILLFLTATSTYRTLCNYTMLNRHSNTL